MTLTAEELLGSFKLPTVSLKIYTRGDLLAEVTRLAEEYSDLGKPLTVEDGPVNAPSGRRDEIYARIQELEAEIFTSEVELEFVALGSTTLRLLQSAHPATEEQAAQGLIANPETFDAALVAACLSSPKMTIDQVEQLFDRIHFGEKQRIIETVNVLNAMPVALPKFVRRSAAEALTERLSSTADATVSPDLFSSVE